MINLKRKRKENGSKYKRKLLRRKRKNLFGLKQKEISMMLIVKKKD
jgi:hypothetical protein